MHLKPSMQRDKLRDLQQVLIVAQVELSELSFTCACGLKVSVEKPVYATFAGVCFGTNKRHRALACVLLAAVMGATKLRVLLASD